MTGAPERLRRILLEFDSFRDFIQVFSPLVAEDGMFVGAEHLGGNLPEVGEKVGFEVRLSDDFRLVHGKGEVAWVRAAVESGSDAGVAIRFLDLDEPSRRLVSRLVSNYSRDGGRPFVLGPPPAAGEGAEVEPEPLAATEAEELFARSPEEPTPVEELATTAPPEEYEETLDIPMSAEEVAEPETAQEVVPTSEPEEPEEADAAPSDSVSEGDILAMPTIDDQEAPAAPAQERAAALKPPLAPVAPVPPVIPDEIAQIAEELSGVHEVPPVEMPSEEQAAVYAGAASAGEGGRSWRAVALAIVGGIAVASVAWFVAEERIKGFLGIGVEEGQPAWVFAERQVPAAVESGHAAEAEAEESAAEMVVATPAGSPAEEEGLPAAEPGDAVSGGLPESEADADAGREALSQPAGPEAVEAAPASAETEPAAVETEPAAVETEPAAVEAAPAPPETAPVPATPAEPSSGTATAVRRVTWVETGTETVLSIELNGTLAEGSYEVVRVRQGAPREVIKIRGIASRLSPPDIEIGSSHVLGLRSGVHQVGGTSELHIVVDLRQSATEVTQVEAEGTRLQITLS